MLTEAEFLAFANNPARDFRYHEPMHRTSNDQKNYRYTAADYAYALDVAENCGHDVKKIAYVKEWLHDGMAGLEYGMRGIGYSPRLGATAQEMRILCGSLRVYLMLIWAKECRLQPVRRSETAKRKFLGRKLTPMERADADISQPVFDHNFWFKDEFDAIVIATHPYNTDNGVIREDYKKRAECWAQKNQLMVEYPNFPSWYYFPSTGLVVFHR